MYEDATFKKCLEMYCSGSSHMLVQLYELLGPLYANYYGLSSISCL